MSRFSYWMTFKVSFFLVLTTGCQAAMTSPAKDNSPAASSVSSTLKPGAVMVNSSSEWPLKFDSHNFTAVCFDTYGCKVQYNGGYHVSQPDNALSPPSLSWGDDYKPRLKRIAGTYIGIRNFPSPATVTWRSKDGEPHQAEIDIGKIFKGGEIAHEVPRQDIREGVSIAAPDILLEVNDRTINVYMTAHVPTKQLQKPDNKYSDFRDDLILVFSQTY